MAKSNRLVKAELINGGRSAQYVSLGAICKIVPGNVPEGFIQSEEFKGKPHMVCEKFIFKAKLRNQMSNELTDSGETKSLEEEMIDFIFQDLGNYSVSFPADAMPSRMDFVHRLEPRGFIRDKKSKEITLGLIKL